MIHRRLPWNRTNLMKKNHWVGLYLLIFPAIGLLGQFFVGAPCTIAPWSLRSKCPLNTKKGQRPIWKGYLTSPRNLCSCLRAVFGGQYIFPPWLERPLKDLSSGIGEWLVTLAQDRRQSCQCLAASQLHWILFRAFVFGIAMKAVNMNLRKPKSCEWIINPSSIRDLGDLHNHRWPRTQLPHSQLQDSLTCFGWYHGICSPGHQSVIVFSWSAKTISPLVFHHSVSSGVTAFTSENASQHPYYSIWVSVSWGWRKSRHYSLHSLLQL